MTSGLLYVPHVLGQVQGATTGAVPWLAGDPRVSFDNGQPVFGTLEHATAWFAAVLRNHTAGPVGLVPVATNYRTADSRTRVNLGVAPDRLREPHRQVAFARPGLQPDPRVLRREFQFASAEAHTRLPPCPDLPRRPGSPGQTPPLGVLQARRSRFAYNRGYQLGYSNAGYATHTRVVAALGAAEPSAAEAIFTRADRCWRSPPPVSPSPTSLDPHPVPAGPLPPPTRRWTAGLALGAAHGALHAAGDLWSMLLRLPHLMSGVQPDRLDAALRQVLATPVLVWADRRMADWATGVSHRSAPSPSSPPLAHTSGAHTGHLPRTPRPAPALSTTGSLTLPTPVRQPPPATNRHR